ncbi:MAG: phosphoribosyltransferase family protein [bacterium]|nr:phosphoribosyltransferase family protein [bacterium]
MALINDFLSLIYPRQCEACANNLFKHERYICNYCKLNLPKSNYHQLIDNPIIQTFAGRIPLANGCTYYLYEKSGRVQKLLHAIKYQEQKELARYVGLLYAKELCDANSLANVDVVIPIPLHKNKLKARGFNQSEWFAKGLSEGLKKPMETVLFERVVDTKTQTKKNRYQRWENVEGIFALHQSESFSDKHILLVDDVITTGATLEAAWLAIKSVPGVKVSVASIAFATKA